MGLGVSTTFLSSNSDEEIVETEEENPPAVISEDRLGSYYVGTANDAESIILTYDEKLSVATTEEEKAQLYGDRAGWLAFYAATEEGAPFREQVLADAFAAEEISHDVQTANLILNIAEMFEDEALFDEWYAILAERQQIGESQ